jgi:Tfp pilus assembly protein PilF
MQIRRRPALGFAILFFFLNHVIESSIIGLELIFEHRNYLPSAFLFLPVAMGLVNLLEAYRRRSPAMHSVIALFIVLLVTGLGTGTYVRNQAWADAKTLWEDALEKSPRSMRAMHNLAYEHYEKKGFHDKALELYRRELGLRCYNKASLALAHNNIASSLFRMGDFQAAKMHLEQALSILPEYESLHYWMASILMNTGEYDSALAVLTPLVSKRPNHFDYLYLKGYIHLKQRDLDEALAYFRRCLMRRPDSLKTYVMIGATLSLRGNYDRAKWFLDGVLKRTPADEATLLYLIDVALQTGDESDARYFANQYLNVAPLGKIPQAITSALQEGFMEKAARERLIGFVTQRALEHIRAGLLPGNGMAVAAAEKIK